MNKIKQLLRYHSWKVKQVTETEIIKIHEFGQFAQKDHCSKIELEHWKITVNTIDV